MNLKTTAYILLFVFGIIFSKGALAKSPLTANELLQSKPLNEHLEAIKKGEIVVLSRAETEGDVELNVIMCVLVPAPLKTTIETLNRQANAKNTPGILTIYEIPDTISPSELDKLFNRLTFNPSETDDVKELMNISPGKEYNLSFKEIAMVKKHAESVKPGSNVKAASLMAKAMSNVLKSRYLSYRKFGLKGLEPYQIDADKQVDPAEQLISATDSLVIVKERFPSYHRCLRIYPDQCESKFVHQYFWVKQKEGERPMFALKHLILDVQADYALISERQYYLSNTLSCLQVVIGCLPYRSDTLVVLLNQAFTEKVNVKMGKTIAKGFGRREVEKKSGLCLKIYEPRLLSKMPEGGFKTTFI